MLASLRLMLLHQRIQLMILPLQRNNPLKRRRKKLYLKPWLYLTLSVVAMEIMMMSLMPRQLSLILKGSYLATQDLNHRIIFLDLRTFNSLRIITCLKTIILKATCCRLFCQTLKILILQHNSANTPVQIFHHDSTVLDKIRSLSCCFKMLPTLLFHYSCSACDLPTLQ